ncbi:type II secretion system protein N [Rhodanobacter sp. C03]|uniref:type II secretion system protein N n=1 Tax=Rhodanobacter sp. C03 TaxID=1945858 RepID=UPI000984A220|nr:type II secretion system protein N [Rhodanobacter sp. C03]OOG54393.1 general secretion pathway protein GspN [Rhodanobacter sp. C03]
MKYLRKCLIGFGILALVVALLLWFLPARLALPWIGPQLHGLRLQQLQGSLWDGHAGQVLTADGHVMGRLQWTLSRRALFGQAQAQLEFHGPPLDFSGGMQRLPDHKLEWHDVSLRAELGTLMPRTSLPLGQPRGELQLNIEHALLQGGWPLQLQAQAQWRHAVMHTRDGDVALGDLHGQAQAQAGVIQAQWHDDGQGPLQVDGQLQLSPLGWRLDATLRARQTDPALRHWLAGLGQPGADGDVHIQRSGGLAATLPGAAATNQSTKPP